MKNCPFFKFLMCTIFLAFNTFSLHSSQAISLRYADIESMKMRIMPCRISVPQGLAPAEIVNLVKDDMKKSFQNFKANIGSLGRFTFEDDSTFNPKNYKSGLRLYVGEDGLADILEWAQALIQPKTINMFPQPKESLNSKFETHTPTLLSFFISISKEVNTLKTRITLMTQVVEEYRLPNLSPSLVKFIQPEAFQKLTTESLHAFSAVSRSYEDIIIGQSLEILHSQAYNFLPPAFKAYVLLHSTKPFSLTNTYVWIENLCEGQEPILNNTPSLQNKGSLNKAYWVFYSILILFWLGSFSGFLAQPRYKLAT